MPFPEIVRQFQKKKKVLLTHNYVRIHDKITQEFQFDNIEVEGEAIDPKIRTLKWYPNENAFHWALNKYTMKSIFKKTKTTTNVEEDVNVNIPDPRIKEFHKWIVNLSESGNITRQEAVSMIPPLVLDIQPEHFVLDMCAAPGSKTCQLLEMLHAKELSTGKLPSGFVIANDLDIKRSSMLVHQVIETQTPLIGYKPS